MADTNPLRNARTPIIIAVIIGTIVFTTWQSREPETFADCILDDLPGTENNVVAHNKIQRCRNATGGYTRDTPLPTSASQDCAIKYAANTSNERAASAIGIACLHRYGLNFDPSTAAPFTGNLDATR